MPNFFDRQRRHPGSYFEHFDHGEIGHGSWRTASHNPTASATSSTSARRTPTTPSTTTARVLDHRLGDIAGKLSSLRTAEETSTLEGQRPQRRRHRHLRNRHLQEALDVLAKAEIMGFTLPLSSTAGSNLPQPRLHHGQRSSAGRRRP